MSDNYLQIGAVAIIFLFAIKEFFAWLKVRRNGNGNDALEALNLMNARLKEMGNDNHHEVIGKLDELVKVNNEQLYILKDVKGSLEKTIK